MPWFKVDDAFHCHPKAMQAGTAALGLWVRCGSWAAQQLTDGFVPTDVARMYGSAAMIRQLVGSGLWLDVDGGYLFPDWTDYQPTREHVLAEREAAKRRQAASRSRRRHAVTDAVTHAVSSAAPTRPDLSVVTDEVEVDLRRAAGA